MGDYSKHTTDKFECHHCRRKKMYPNERDNKIMGYICAYCGLINYPYRDSMTAKINTKGDAPNGI